MTTTRTDDDLERLLRSTLRARGAGVDTGPTWTEDGDGDGDGDGDSETVGPSPRTARRPWQAPLIAAAVVAAVAGTLVAVRHDGDVGKSPVGHHSAKPSPPVTTPKITTPPAAANRACLVPLPGAWRAALTSYDSSATGTTDVWGVADGGALVVTRDLGTSRDVALLRPGRSPEIVYRVHDPETTLPGVVTVEGGWAVVDVDYQPRSTQETVATTSMVVLVDLHTHASRVLARARRGSPNDGRLPTINGATLQDGRVYWDVKAHFGSTTGQIRSYDIATGARQVVYQGPLPGGFGGAPAAVAGGVAVPTSTGALRLLRRAELPGDLGRRIDDATIADQRLATDGTGYAWINRSGTAVTWWTPDAQGIRVVSLPPTARGPLGARNPMQLSGHWLVYGPEGTPSFLLDLAHRGVSRIPFVDGRYFIGSDGPALGGFGHPADAPAIAPIRVDTASLPNLNC